MELDGAVRQAAVAAAAAAGDHEEGGGLAGQVAAEEAQAGTAGRAGRAKGTSVGCVWWFVQDVEEGR